VPQTNRGDTVLTAARMNLSSRAETQPELKPAGIARVSISTEHC